MRHKKHRYMLFAVTLYTFGLSGVFTYFIYDMLMESGKFTSDFSLFALRFGMATTLIGFTSIGALIGNRILNAASNREESSIALENKESSESLNPEHKAEES